LDIASGERPKIRIADACLKFEKLPIAATVAVPGYTARFKRRKQCPMAAAPKPA
jgi:hypothetical protein